MKMPIPKLTIQELLEEVRGDVTYHALGDLGELAAGGDASALEALILYAEKGKLNFCRGDAVNELNEVVKRPNPRLAKRFRRWLRDPALRYWAIPAYLNAAGPRAYRDLIKVAKDPSIQMEERAHAVKCLARAGKQPFDRGLDQDMSRWKETDLRVGELVAWAKSGFRKGKGYSKPKQHVALSHPRTAFERTVAQLGRMLAEQRGTRDDPATPANWLTPASPKALREVAARWDLPKTYFDFLARFSPMRMCVSVGRFDGLILYGADELINAQYDYTHDTETGKRLPDWPDQYVLIGSVDLDPFALDLSKSDGKEAPVMTARHGLGYWKFRRRADSFHAFLQRLVK